MAWAGSFGRALIGLILLVAAVTKLLDRDRLATIVTNYQLLPDRLSRPVAWLMPIAEGLLALALLSGVGVDAAAIGAALLFVVFSVAIAVNLWRGRHDIACGCFGARAMTPIRWRYVVRNLALATVALLSAPVVLASSSTFFMSPTGEPVSPRLSLEGELAMGLAAAVGLACYALAATSIGMLRRAAINGNG